MVTQSSALLRPSLIRASNLVFLIGKRTGFVVGRTRSSVLSVSGLLVLGPPGLTFGVFAVGSFRKLV